jgi:hypothetical protein
LISMKVRFRLRVKNSAKKLVSRIVLFFLGRAFQVLYRYDEAIRREVDEWRPGFTLCMRVCRTGPSICLRHAKQGGVERVKLFDPSKADMAIEFRSIDAAFLVLSGQIGVPQAYAQHRFTLRGSIYDCMSLVRSVEVIEAYLFPGFMARKILKRIPRKEIFPVSVYWYAISGQ